MSIKEGYKETEIGIIPEDWEVKKLINYCSKITDGSHFSPVPIKEGKYIIATVKDMNKNEFNFSTCAKISENDFLSLKKNGCSPEIGDVLFSKDGTIGKTFVYNSSKEIVLLSSIAIIKPIKSLLDSKFTSFILLSDIFYKQLEGLKSGSALKRVVLKAIKEIKTPLPPLLEQKKIASILSTVDEKISCIQSAIEKTQELKKGLMQELLTKGIGHTEFKDSEIGRIPKSWELKLLVNFALEEKNSFVNGPFGSDLLSEELTDKGVPVIYVRDIKEGLHQHKSTAHVTPEKAEKLSFCNVLKGDIILTKVGDPPCDAAIYENDSSSIITQDVMRIRPNTKIIAPKFLVHLINSNIGKSAIEKIIIEGTRKRVSLKSFKNIYLPMPSKDEQIEIAKILDTIVTKKKVLESKKLHYETLKKGLMQKLLTGEVRVKIEDEKRFKPDCTPIEYSTKELVVSSEKLS